MTHLPKTIMIAVCSSILEIARRMMKRRRASADRPDDAGYGRQRIWWIFRH